MIFEVANVSWWTLVTNISRKTISLQNEIKCILILINVSNGFRIRPDI